MKSNLLKIFLLVLINFCLVYNVCYAQKTNIDFFYSSTCPHCSQEKEFLQDLEKNYSDLTINYYEFSKNSDLVKEKYQLYNVPQSKWGYVPVTFIADQYFIGFDEAYGLQIKQLVIENLKKPEIKTQPAPEEFEPEVDLPAPKEVDINFEEAQPLLEEAAIQTTETAPRPEAQSNKEQLVESDALVFGKINPQQYSPFFLAVALGFLDGFNACAMVALGFLLTVLIATGIRRKVILIGGTFILVSGIIYFLFIAAWLNLFLVVSHLRFINAAVGVIILLFAIFLLRDYYKGVICKACQIKPSGKEGILVRFERKLFLQMDKIAKAHYSTPLMLLGVALVAAGINLVELACSFGFPLAFTNILVGLQLPAWQYYLYLAVYVVFYMIDDFIIFLVAVFTLRIGKASDKYLRIIKLISGILMLLLALVLLIRPQWIVFDF